MEKFKLSVVSLDPEETEPQHIVVGKKIQTQLHNINPPAEGKGVVLCFHIAVAVSIPRAECAINSLGLIQRR